MKKLLVVLLALALVFAFAACAAEEAPVEETPVEGGEEAAEGLTAETIKVGHIHINDEAEQGYSTAHINGVTAACEALGIPAENVIGKYNISEDDSCDTALRELVEAGCNIIFADSFGHEDFLLEVAAEYPDVVFCHATGYQAASSGLDNVANYFGNIYEARYLTGIVAGMTTATNKLGYVTAQQFAECVSGLTAFYLGAKSVNPDVTMDIMFTNTWYDVTLESQAAQALIDGGADVLGQHADSAATQTTAEAAGKYAVGYNTDMSVAAPAANLCSAVWNWAPAYEHFIAAVLNGEAISDYSGSMAEGMVDIVYNDALIDSLPNGAEIRAAVDAARAGIEAGTLHVFATDTWTVDGAVVESTADLDGFYGVEYISDGYFHESEYASAPAFFFFVDGVNVIQ
ncbi:MAG: BMP family ABC transporter substrate-binding protein [Bacillota bacterium]|nr:BMP family ABC transporter substrate-binding protein [Bacillota bacterium]